MTISIRVNQRRVSGYVLHEAIALAAALLFLLELHELELTKRLEDILEVVFGDGEVDVADVETVEWDAVGLSSCRLGGACLTVLLCFRELCDDWNAEQLLSCERNSFLHRVFFFEFDVTNTIGCQRALGL